MRAAVDVESTLLPNELVIVTLFESLGFCAYELPFRRIPVEAAGKVELGNVTRDVARERGAGRVLSDDVLEKRDGARG